jgi:hypothetical protein
MAFPLRCGQDQNQMRYSIRIARLRLFLLFFYSRRTVLLKDSKTNPHSRANGRTGFRELFSTGIPKFQSGYVSVLKILVDGTAADSSSSFFSTSTLPPGDPSCLSKAEDWLYRQCLSRHTDVRHHEGIHSRTQENEHDGIHGETQDNERGVSNKQIENQASFPLLAGSASHDKGCLTDRPRSSSFHRPDPEVESFVEWFTESVRSDATEELPFGDAPPQWGYASTSYQAYAAQLTEYSDRSTESHTFETNMMKFTAGSIYESAYRLPPLPFTDNNAHSENSESGTMAYYWGIRMRLVNRVVDSLWPHWGIQAFQIYDKLGELETLFYRASVTNPILSEEDKVEEVQCV